MSDLTRQQATAEEVPEPNNFTAGVTPMFTRDQKVRLAARDSQIIDQQEELHKIMEQIQLHKELRQAKQELLRKEMQDAAAQLELAAKQDAEMKA